LAYSFNWGSGTHRSQVAVLDCLAKEPREVVAPQSLFMDFDHDWTVTSVDKHGVRVEGGKVVFGELELRERDGLTTLRVRLRPDLAEALRRNVAGAPADDGPPANRTRLPDQEGSIDANLSPTEAEKKDGILATLKLKGVKTAILVTRDTELQFAKGKLVEE